jgi:flagellar basal-body rod modification protein FlgD
MINLIKAATTPPTATTPTTNTGLTGTSGTAGTTSTGGASTSSTATGGVTGAATLGGTDFLTLMLAQLQNQDPTNPVDSNTFLTQLAQLSEVQGINTLNTSFSTLSSSLTSAQTLQASSLLGKDALVTSSTVNQTAGATVTGAVTVPQTTSSVTLGIVNSAGQTVRTLALGAQAAGQVNFSWDGKDSSGALAPTGTYNLVAVYGGQTTSSAAATTAVNGTVDSVSMGAGSSGMTLNVAGVGSVPMSSLLQISN